MIHPALEAGKVVVADRYLLANVVYQGHGGGLDVPTLWQVGEIATGGLMPDLTLVLDLPSKWPPPASAARPIAVSSNGKGPISTPASAKDFLAKPRQQSGRIVIIDAGQPIERVQADLRLAARTRAA